MGAPMKTLYCTGRIVRGQLVTLRIAKGSVN